MTPDSELLRRFAKTNSEDAFAELVKRHVNLVYSAALRQVNGDAHLAQDVAQTVFADLARKAGSLSSRETLTGWLYTSAHFAAAKIARTENRRRDREEKFMREPTNENEVGRVTPCAPDWEQIRPMLDKVMHELKEADREAILLRYFENRPFAEVGAKLGLNENAARMRVERALEKLRGIFTERGITTATALASVISANAVQIAPANLAATLTAASIATAGTGTFTLLKIMTMAKLKLGISALIATGAATALVVQHQTKNELRAENVTLQQQIAQMQTANKNYSNQLANIRLANVGDSKTSQTLSADQSNELLKLRGEVGVLRRQLASQKAQAVQQTAPSREARNARLSPNTFISKDQLTNAGFDTPEATWQTYIHGFTSGNYDETVSAFSSSVRPPANDSKDRQGFENAYHEGGSSFQGQQILAKKAVSDAKVDLEVLIFSEGKAPEISIQHMVKEGNQWKFVGSASVSPDWGKDGQIQSLAPFAN